MEQSTQEGNFVADGIPYAIAAMTEPDEIRQCFDTLRILRPNCEHYEVFLEQISRLQRKYGYRLCTAKRRSALVVGVIGFRFLENLMHGRHVYVDDLVILPEFRGVGIGGELLKFVITQARAEQCKRVLLDTGMDNVTAARFYVNLGFRITAHRFTMNLD